MQTGTVAHAEGGIHNVTTPGVPEGTIPHEGSRVDFRATVELTTNVGIKQDLTLTTDANGSFSAELPSGLFTMFWSRPPPSRRIVGRFDLTPGQKATFNAKLSVSLIVVKELPGPRVSAPK